MHTKGISLHPSLLRTWSLLSNAFLNLKGSFRFTATNTKKGLLGQLAWENTLYKLSQRQSLLPVLQHLWHEANGWKNLSSKGTPEDTYENSCTCTRNLETSTMIINFPLRLGNNFASLNTPCTGKKTCFSDQLPQGKWWTLCGRTSRN